MTEIEDGYYTLCCFNVAEQMDVFMAACTCYIYDK